MLRNLVLPGVFFLLASVHAQQPARASDAVDVPPLAAEEGAYVVAYVTNDAIRRAMEDQLVADLAERNIVAHKSYRQLPDLRDITGKALVAAARGERAAALVLLSPVAADENKRLDSPLRRSPEADPEAFYEYTRWAEANIDPSGPVFAEVNAFAIIGNEPVLAWSGTAWSFEADGAGGAVREISQEVADELVKIRNMVRAPD